MKFSENWFREWTSPNRDSNDLAEQLSLAGLEVDEVLPVAPHFTNVVVGKVLSLEKHPDANRLRVTQVDVGASETIQIVCGAKNVAVGMKVCCAKVGAVLPGNFKIQAAKLRGVASHGMLCGATEIGLADEGVDGLHILPQDAPVGLGIREYLNLNDTIIDVDLTPNRADCLSIEGMARDAAAMDNIAWQQPYDSVKTEKSGACSQTIVIEDKKSCPKYLGCIVTDYNLMANTPSWMVQRIERAGLSSKSLVVDITNYVLLELGQPMHAFDLDKLSGSIKVRQAVAGEFFTTLDEKELTIQLGSLVIADDSGVIALAGIMGGLATAVSKTTTKVFFECAHFTPLSIVGKARSYGLHTDSSHRFERGVDPLLPDRALERALSLFVEIAGGKVSEVISQISEKDMPVAKIIQLRPERVTKLLGAKISAQEIENIFHRLGFGVKISNYGWEMTAPSYRFDMEIEADLIEEVGRIYGYNNLPEVQIEAPVRLPNLPESEQELYSLKQALVQRGYQEVVTYSFVEEKVQEKLVPELPFVVLKNPISDDMKAMRTTLFLGLLSTISYNQNRQQNRIKIFESGLTFIKLDGDLKQLPVIGGAVVGSKCPANWAVEEDRNMDFFDLKGDVETLLSMSHIKGKVRFEAHEYAIFHPGQSAAITLNGRTIGFMGQLHPSHTKMVGVSGKVFLFEIRLDALSKMTVPTADKLSKFPEVQRDLAFVVEESLPVQDLLDAVKEVESDILQSVELFDVYRGEGVENNQKSIALNLRIQHIDRTLQDEEVEAVVLEVIKLAEQKVSACLR